MHTNIRTQRRLSISIGGAGLGRGLGGAAARTAHMLLHAVSCEVAYAPYTYTLGPIRAN
jgi:hypothetical protein